MYNFAINLYSFAAKVDSLFNKKVKKMLDGQKNCFETLRSKIEPNSQESVRTPGGVNQPASIQNIS